LEARLNKKYPVIDTHAHLEDVADLEQALRRAKEADISGIIAVGCCSEANERVLEICKTFTDFNIYVALGLHPGNLEGEDIDKAIGFIEKNIAQAVAVGEIGLDYWYKPARKDGPARSLQQDVFARQLELAKRHDLPVSIHSRGAWKECLKMAKEAGIKKCVFHWYSGPEDILEDVLKAGFFISATPAAEYSPEHRKAIEKTPLERLFLETDSPVRFKPEAGPYESQPQDVLRSLKAVAQIKGEGQNTVARVTTRNAVGFFRLEGGF